MIVFWIFFVNTLVSPARNSLRVGTVFPTRVGNQANRASIVYKEYPKTMFRTYLKNTSARDMSQFSQGQGATTMVYLNGTPRRIDAGIAEIGHIPKGCGCFAPRRRWFSLAYRRGYALIVAPSPGPKPLAPRAGCIF